MRNLFAKLSCILLVQLFILSTSERALSYTGENADGWDYAFEISEKCFESGPDGALVGQIDANFCIANALGVAEAEMNGIFSKLLAVLVEVDMLKDSQRAWLEFRDLECKLRTSGMGEGGSGRYFIDSSCTLDLTLKRINDLKHLDAYSYCNGCPERK